MPRPASDPQRTFSIEQLDALVTKIFVRAGFSPLQARSVAGVIVACERDGCKSHGVYRIDGCLATARAGKVDVLAQPALREDDSAIVRVDAHGAYSNAAFEVGVAALVRRARQFGIAAMVINDCTHFSALWPEIEELTSQGLAALAMCPSYATVAPAGGTTPVLGTNPFAFGFPRQGELPYVFDFATSIAARGEIELHRRAGTPLPEGWALDANGQPTTDPEAALAGAMLPFGDYKGSALSTMIELLAAAMIGDMNSREALDWLGTTAYAPRHGELIIALDPARFSSGRPGNPLDRAEALLDAISGQSARLPSQRRFAARERSQREGVRLSAEEADHLEALAAGDPR